MKRIYHTLFSILGLLAFYSTALAQEWIPINGTERGSTVSQKVLRDDASTYQVEFTINGLYDQAITNGHGSFHHLSFTKGGSWQALGDPSLPVISQLIAIPSGAMMSPSVTDEEWVDIDMPTIYPAQKLLREGETLKEFVINEQSYRQPFLPPLISLGDQMKWRGINNKPLAVCPFKYYPQNGKLSVLRHFVLRVDLLPSDE